MANYYVREEDGTSQYVLEDASGSILEEAAGATKAGFADAHGVASGESASVNAETGFANVAGVAAGASAFVAGPTDAALFGPSSFAELDFGGGGQTRVYLGLQVYRSSAQEAAETGFNAAAAELDATTDSEGLEVFSDETVVSFSDYSTGAGALTADAWHTLEICYEPGATPTLVAFDGVTGVSNSTVHAGQKVLDVLIGHFGSSGLAHGGFYIGHVWIGTDIGLNDILNEDWSSRDFSNWTSTGGSPTIVLAPTAPPAFSSAFVETPTGSSGGRVFIAFDDGPLVASPTWTRIDGGDDPFPQNFVSGYDVTSGRQTLLSQTDTGTATVYINDHVSGLFDPRNVSSPYFGKLDGSQILLQLYDPVAATWEDQFRGHIDEASYDIDGSAADANGDPINASIQLDCVDLFAFLADYGLTPGLDGVSPQAVPSGTAGGAPPSGGEDGVWYATTTGTNDDRMIEILADVGIPVDMYGSPSFASGNVHVAAVKYDPDESALQALRDAADADLPFIANIFCDRHGRFQFHGRYARFDPDGVSAEPGSDWDFTRWAVGDGDAIVANPTRAQMRILQYGRGRRDIINVATAYPQGLKPADMVDQIFANTASITAYGKHSAPPMSDLLLNPDEIQPVTGLTGKVECFRYAKLMVLNQKDPREAITALQLKAIRPDDARATATWALITKADISHIVNVAVGYPGGTGFTGASPDDDYYIEGRQLRVRPLNKTHDYVELDLEVSPAVWSMDTHGVFPAFGDITVSTPPELILTADFDVAV